MDMRPKESDSIHDIIRQTLEESGEVLSLDTAGRTFLEDCILCFYRRMKPYLDQGMIPPIEPADWCPGMPPGLSTNGFRVVMGLFLINLAASRGEADTSSPRRPQDEELILENKRLRRELESMCQRYALVFQNNPFPVFITDFDGCFLDANPETIEFLGFETRQELLRHNVIEFYANPERDRARVLERLREEKHVRGLEIEIQRRDGSTAIIEVASRVIEIGGQQVIESVGTDISTRKWMEKQLAEYQRRLEGEVRERTKQLRSSELKYRTLVHYANDGIIIVQNGRIVFANEATGRMIGRKFDLVREEVYFLDWVVPEERERVREFYERWQEGRELPTAWETMLLSDRGGRVLVEVKPALIRYEGRPAVMAILRDVTMQKNLEQQLVRSQKMEGLGKLAGGIAHDFNNVLGAILGYASYLGRWESLPEKARKMGQVIAQTAIHGSELTSRLLGFARMGKAETVAFDLNDLVNDIVELLSRSIPKNIDIRLETRDIGPSAADRSQLYHALLNLCLNAIEAMPEGGSLTIFTDRIPRGELPPGVEPSLEKADEYIVIRVQDTGVGMDTQILQHVFEPFYTTKSRGEATGLGLSMVYGIVTGHGGHIDVESNPGRGSTFTIYLPLRQAPQPEEELRDEFQHGNGETILVVDDEPFIREFARDVLQEFNYNPVLASSGGEALEFFRKPREPREPISVVLLDIMMPGLDGYGTAEMIRRLSPETDIIFTSGLREDDRLSRFMGQPGFFFLKKPFAIEKLLVLLHHLSAKQS